MRFTRVHCPRWILQTPDSAPTPSFNRAPGRERSWPCRAEAGGQPVPWSWPEFQLPDGRATESESPEELDLLVDALKQIAREAAENPDLVKTAPHTTRLQRLDETGAARKPILRWKAPIASTAPTPDTARQ